MRRLQFTTLTGVSLLALSLASGGAMAADSLLVGAGGAGGTPGGTATLGAAGGGGGIGGGGGGTSNTAGGGGGGVGGGSGGTIFSGGGAGGSGATGGAGGVGTEADGGAGGLGGGGGAFRFGGGGGALGGAGGSSLNGGAGGIAGANVDGSGNDGGGGAVAGSGSLYGGGGGSNITGNSGGGGGGGGGRVVDGDGNDVSGQAASAGANAPNSLTISNTRAYDYVGVGGGGGGGGSDSGNGDSTPGGAGSAGTLTLTNATLTTNYSMLVGGAGGGAGFKNGGNGGSGTVALQSSSTLSVTQTLLIGGSGGGGGLDPFNTGADNGGNGGAGSVTVDATSAIAIGAGGNLVLGGANGGNFSSGGTGGTGGTGTLSSAGTLTFGAGAGFTINSGSTFNLGTAVAGASTTGTITGLSSVANNGTINFNQSNSTYTFAASITGSGNLNQNGSGTTTLTGSAGTFTGTVNVTAGTLALGAGGVMSSADTSIGVASGSTGALSVSGAGASWTIASGGQLVVGDSGTGSLTVGSGGLLTSQTVFLGYAASGAGTLTLTGNDSDGRGMVATTQVRKRLGSGEVVFNGGGLRATADQSDFLSGFLSSDIDIQSGGAIIDTNGRAVTISQDLSGTGGLTKQGTGTLTLSGINTYTGATTITAGTLALSGAGSIASSSSVLVDGTFDISGITAAGTSVTNLSGNTTTGVVALGTKTLTVTQQTEFLQLAGALTGSGTLVKQGVEALTLSGDSSGYSGTIEVNAGTLSVTDWGGLTVATVGGNITVASGAILEGAGATINGAVTVGAGGILEWTRLGANIGNIVMGSLTLDAGAVTRINLAAPTSGTGMFEINGNATVDGTLNLLSAPAYGAGVYRVFTTTGSLTDNGLALGETQPDYTFRIDSQAQSLDVVVTTLDTDVQYWSGNGTTRGGGGNWTAFNNWLGADGGYAAWAGHTAVFDGTLGIVMVDGTQSFGTIEFLTSGYNLQAGVSGELNLGTGGRLWAEGDDIIVTVTAPIIGTGALTKIGAGTIVLAGTNTYSGGTIIQAGTLEISSDANLGAAAGTITFAGGELETTATIVSNRNVVLNALGVINVEEASSLTLNGTISGTGGLALGSGTLILTGTNTYQGVTTIADGTLSLTGTGSIAASAGVVANGTLDISGTTSGASITSLSGTGSVVMGAQALTITNASGAFSGTIGGTGGLTLTAGTQALSGVNGFTGATSILGGTLALTGGGSLAASSGLLVGGTFDISGVTGGGTSIRTLSGTGAVVLGANVLTLTNPSGTFQGAISGLGGLTISSGTLTLTGDNTYTGVTVISGGALQVGDGGTTGAIVGDVTNNGTLVFNRSGTLSLAGAISGTGNVVQAGPGTLILTGAGSYSGGTAVLAGGLVLGSSTAAGTGVITLFDGTSLGLTDGVSVANALALSGAVTFDIASGTATASGAISGTGSIAFSGGGRITLTGDSSAFSGATTVDGTLSVNGVLGGTVSVLAGGTLKGSGTVGSTSVAAGGTVAPGNSIGTLTVDGTLTFASGATYAVEIDTTGASDLILVTGTATLGGATVDVTKAAGSYLPGTHYTILTAQGGLDGTFGTLTQDMPFIDLLLSYDTQNAYLDVARNATPFPSVAVTANQRATAAAVEGLGQGNAVYNAVVSQTSVAGAQQAFNTLDGEIYPSALSVLQQESLILRRAVLDRARVPASTGTTAPLAYAAGSAAGADVVGMAGSPNAFWAQAFGAWSQIDGNGNAATISGDTAGVIVGYDRTFAGNGADWRLGFAAGYSSSGYQVDDRSSSFSSDTAHVALYGGTSMGALGIRAGAAYSWADISASRTVAFPGFLNALDADTSARTGQVFGEVGYGLSFAKVQVEPFAGLAYVNVDMNGFTELGGPSALTASGTSAGVTYSTLGARLSIPFSLGALPAAFNGTLAWQHAFGDTSPDMLFAFGPGALPFSISGVPIASDAALVEAGLDLTVAPNAALSVFYAGQLSQSETSNMVKGSFTLKF